MSQEIQALLFFTLWAIVMNTLSYGFLRGKLGEKSYDWRMKRNLIMDNVSKEDYVRKMRKISSFVIILVNIIYVLLVISIIFKQ